MVAYQSNLGAVSDFIKRYLHDNVGSNWGQLKTDLTSRFAEITDPQHAFVLLRKVKQRTYENVQFHAERLLSLAEEALAGQNGGVAAIVRQLVGVFMDGLVHDYLKMRMMRANPATLQVAVASAMTEQNLRKRFNLRIGRVTDSNVCHIEPMKLTIHSLQNIALNIINWGTMQRTVIIDLILILNQWNLIMHSPLNIATFAIN